MVPIAQPAEAAHPASDDEKLKRKVDGLQSISPHALQILAAAAQNASQEFESETPKQLEGESSKQGCGGIESESRQRSILCSLRPLDAVDGAGNKTWKSKNSKTRCSDDFDDIRGSELGPYSAVVVSPRRKHRTCLSATQFRARLPELS